MMKFVALMICGAALLAGGCEQKKAAATGAAPATQVVAVEARRETVFENLSLVGSLLPDEMVDIKSEIEGVVLEINFEEGKPVEKGQLLVRLDGKRTFPTGDLLAERGTLDGNIQRIFKQGE